MGFLSFFFLYWCRLFVGSLLILWVSFFEFNHFTTCLGSAVAVVNLCESHVTSLKLLIVIKLHVNWFEKFSVQIVPWF